MSRPRFLADHDLNEHILTGALRQEPAIEIVRVRDVDMSRQADHEILAFAEREGMLVLSHDVNTMPAAAYARLVTGQSIAGLFMIQQTLPISSVIDSVVLIWSASELEEWRDQVVYLPFDQ
ncbi:MAG: DUF5615 family PIN-like protein [Planctomycetes bacterium]|nr:DUF5615 family PIN-like protein [Planctomycetota bacterium]